MAGRDAQASETDFGLLGYWPENLGDPIQSLAARPYLPRVDHFLCREALDSAPPGDRPIRLILNGWFMHSPEHWPPHPRIRPLLVSIHITGQRRSRWRRLPPASTLMLRPDGVDYLRRHGPVGARDRATLELLRDHGIDAWLSGCLTLTLRAPPSPESAGRVVACDLPAELLAALNRRLSRPAIETSHIDRRPADAAAQLAKAERLLGLYAGARAVVTTRLHCALPCLGLGTPVLYIPNAPDPDREAIGVELAHSCSARDFLAGAAGFDPEDPPLNPTMHEALAAELDRTCRAFVAG
jgi:hypothetical protein